MLADTKTVRSIVNEIVGVSADYTDKGANDTRLLAWCIGNGSAARLVQEAKTALTLAGFTNRVTCTSSNYTGCGSYRTGGFTYLRINASYNK